jgi:hypothetical protein
VPLCASVGILVLPSVPVPRGRNRSALSTTRKDMDPKSAEKLLEKVRAFVAGLPEEERALFAALIAPGIAQAYVEDEVAGFAMTEWSATRLPAVLAEAIQRSRIRVLGLESGN